MDLRDYEYKGLIAEAWDVLRGDTSGWADRSFYREIIRRSGEPVLDVGCGTGRLLLDYLSQGIDSDGVDNSPEMLTLCRRKADDMGLAPNLYEQYMETLDLPRHYRTILIPSSSLSLITCPSDVAQALQRVYDHLQPGGCVAAPLMTFRKEGTLEGDPLEALEAGWENSATRPEDGTTFRRVSRWRFDPGDGCDHTEDRYQKIIGGEVVAEELHQQSPATRSYTQAEARDLFKRAGFVDVQLYREFTFDPVTPEDRGFTVVGQKPA